VSIKGQTLYPLNASASTNDLPYHREDVGQDFEWLEQGEQVEEHEEVSEGQTLCSASTKCSMRHDKACDGVKTGCADRNANLIRDSSERDVSRRDVYREANRRGGR
jgi:hypothetical protein